MNSTESKSKNPFQHRWKLEDPIWVNNRKKKWLTIENNLRQSGEGLRNKDIKHLKAFIISGVEPPKDTIFNSTHRLAFTPSETEDDVREVLKYAEPTEFSDILDYAAFRLGYGTGQEKLIANALYSQTYQESYELFKNNKYLTYIPANRFANEFVNGAYRFFTGKFEYKYYPLPYTLNYFFSCIRHLEAAEIKPKYHPWLRNLLSIVCNFVEPRVVLDEKSDVAAFAQQFAALLHQDNTPISLKQALIALGPNQMLEYPIDSPPKDEVFFTNFKLYNDWSAPDIRVLHGADPTTALTVLLQCAKRVNLLASDYQLPTAQAVNLQPLMSDEFLEQMGFDQSPIPGYRYTLWFTPKQLISNNTEAQFGVDLLIPLREDAEDNRDAPVLIYYPRLSEHYRKWHVTEVLLLLERKLRREFASQSDAYFYLYDEDTDCIESKDDVLGYCCRQTGYLPLADYKSGTMELAVDGPDLEDWTGEKLPPEPVAEDEVISINAKKPRSVSHTYKKPESIPDKGYINLAAILVVTSIVSRNDVLKLLAVDTRPDFEDEVPEEQRALLELIDGLAFPDALMPLGTDQIFVHWQYLEEEFEELDESLLSVGVVIQKAQVYSDDPSVDPEYDGLYYIRDEENQLECVNPHETDLKMPIDFQDKPNNPSELQALMQNFSTLKF